MAVGPARVRTDVEPAADVDAPRCAGRLDRRGARHEDEAVGITGDVHLVGGPATAAAFHEIGALAEAWFHVLPMALGTGIPLAPAASAPLSLELLATKAWPDGVVELRYAVRRPA